MKSKTGYSSHVSILLATTEKKKKIQTLLKLIRIEKRHIRRPVRQIT